MRVFVCACGEVIRGSDEVETMREISDHMRVVHPERYRQMIAYQPIERIRQWMKMRITSRRLA